MSYNKIPFDKKIADQVLSICDLFIELAKVNNKLTLEEIIYVKDKFQNMYYNEKVELLEVAEK